MLELFHSQAVAFGILTFQVLDNIVPCFQGPVGMVDLIALEVSCIFLQSKSILQPFG